jgi:hypothetical protein
MKLNGVTHQSFMLHARALAACLWKGTSACMVSVARFHRCFGGVRLPDSLPASVMAVIRRMRSPQLNLSATRQHHRGGNITALGARVCQLVKRQHEK